MPVFNPEPQKTNDPSYLGTSQGTEKAGMQPLAEQPNLKVISPTQYSADQTYGKIFEGIGDVVGTAAKGALEAIQSHARQDTQKAVSGVIDEFGAARAAADPNQGRLIGALGGVSDQNVPAVVNKLGNRISHYNEAYQGGYLSESYFLAKVESEIRKVKAAYPGFTDYVDQVATSQLATPANHLRRELLKDVTELARKQQSSADKYMTYLHSNQADVQRAIPDFWERQSSANPYSQYEVFDRVGRIQANDKQVQSDTARLALLHSTGNLTNEEAERKFTSTFDTAVRQTLQASVLSANTDMGKLWAQAKEYQNKSEPIPPLLQDQLRAALQQTKAQLRTLGETIMSTPWNPNIPNSGSHRERIKDPGRRQALIDNGMQQFDLIEKSLTDNQLGTFALAVNMTKAITDNDMANAVRENETVRKLVLYNSVNSKLLETLAVHDPKFLGETIQLSRTISLANILTGSDTDMKKTVDLSKKDKAFTNQIVNDLTTAITHKDTDDKTSVNAATALFARRYNFMTKFDVSEQPNIYMRLMAPKVTDKMFELKAKGDANPSINYVNFAEDGFKAIFKTQLDTIQEGINDKDVKITLDPKSLQLQAEIKPQAYERGSLMDRTFSTDYNGPLVQINKTLSALKYVYEKDGRDPQKAVAQLVKTVLQVNPSEAPSTGIMQHISDGIAEALAESMKHPSERKKK